MVAARETELLKELEHLLDYFEDEIPPKIYRKLEEIYDELNKQIPELEQEIDDLKDLVSELEEKIENLK